MAQSARLRTPSPLASTLNTPGSWEQTMRIAAPDANPSNIGRDMR